MQNFFISPSCLPTFSTPSAIPTHHPVLCFCWLELRVTLNFLLFSLQPICCLVHNFYIHDQGGRQMCLSAVKLDHGGKLFWDTPSWLSVWVSVFWAWRMDLNKGVPTLFAYCEKLIWTIFFKFKQGTCPWMAFAWNFFGGSVGQIIYRE